MDRTETSSDESLRNRCCCATGPEPDEEGANSVDGRSMEWAAATMITRSEESTDPAGTPASSGALECATTTAAKIADMEDRARPAPASAEPPPMGWIARTEAKAARVNGVANAATAGWAVWAIWET